MTGADQQEPLARQVVAQAQLIAKLREDLDELAHETTQAVTGLITRLEEAGSGGSQGSSPAAWCWRDIGPRAADELWTQLTDWVDWIRHRYPLARKIPDCWAEHPETVEELTALWLAWQAAYTERDAPLTAAADWHDRWLPGLLHRLEHGAFSLDCTNGHQPRPSTAYASEPEEADPEGGQDEDRSEPSDVPRRI